MNIVFGKTMCRNIIFCDITFCSIMLLHVVSARTGGSTVRVRGMRVPAALLNDSVSSVVLDCDYAVTSGGANITDSGLVVKWFHSSSAEPVYQWIPGHRPQAFGLLRGRVNLGHVVTTDPVSRHRALQILRPTSHLSGWYTCRVSTWDNVDSATRRMIVYAPEELMTLATNQLGVGRVNISCSAAGMFPEPQLQLFVGSSARDRVRLGGSRVEKSWSGGSYRVQLFVTADHSQLPAEAVIECVLSLPSTEYSRTKRTMYFHEQSGLWTQGNGGGSLRSAHYASALILCRLLFILLQSC